VISFFQNPSIYHNSGRPFNLFLIDEVPWARGTHKGIQIPSLSNSTAEFSCTNPPRGQCTFWRECPESKYQCDGDGYLIGQGKTICETLAASLERLTPSGEEWMLDVMQCLQKSLFREARAAPYLPDDRVSSPKRHSKRCSKLYDRASRFNPGTLSARTWALRRNQQR
jgi:hypothetical protein